MTGTSIDAVDAAAVQIVGRGLRARAGLLGTASAPLGALRDRLRALQRQEPTTAADFASLGAELARAHLPALRELEAKHGSPALLVVHGQTLFHAPPTSLQWINPTLLMTELGCDVLFDLRARDLSLGGQGAPITPLADWMLFRSPRRARVIVNLGGFANATRLPRAPLGRGSARDTAWIDGVRGFDVCLCNQLLDHLARTRIGEAFDRSGNRASRGTASVGLQRELEGMLMAQAQSGRSLGTADEVVSSAASALRDLPSDDALATAAAAVGAAIGQTIDDPSNSSDAQTTEVLAAGGGVHHKPLMAAIERTIGRRIQTTQALGIAPEARESTAMAVLGALAVDGVPITLPAVTGRRHGSGQDGILLRGTAATFTQSSHGAAKTCEQQVR